MKIRFLVAVVLGVFATFSTIVAQTISQSNSQPQTPSRRGVSTVFQTGQQLPGLTSSPKQTRFDPGIPLPPASYTPTPPASYPALVPGTSYPPGPQQSYLSYSTKPDSVQHKVDQKLREYKKAKSSSDKSKLKDELHKLLETQFDERLKRPVAAIENSRKRLDQLSEQYKARENQSKEIVSLRLKVLINEAKGLGWKNSRTNSVRWHYAPGIASPTRPSTGAFAIAPASLPVPNKPNIARVIKSPNISKTYPNQNTANQAQETHHSLLADYKESDDESKKEEIIDKLTAVLTKEFEAHQDQIQKQIDGIETQISDLEENIEKRKEAKDDIVELKLKSLINQANGLGF